jgi:hypothetical protein
MATFFPCWNQRRKPFRVTAIEASVQRHNLVQPLRKYNISEDEIHTMRKTYILPITPNESTPYHASLPVLDGLAAPVHHSQYCHSPLASNGFHSGTNCPAPS